MRDLWLDKHSFPPHVLWNFNEVLSKTDAGRCKCIKVECFENDKNSSIYEE